MNIDSIFIILMRHLNQRLSVIFAATSDRSIVYFIDDHYLYKNPYVSKHIFICFNPFMYQTTCFFVVGFKNNITGAIHTMQDGDNLAIKSNMPIGDNIVETTAYINLYHKPSPFSCQTVSPAGCRASHVKTSMIYSLTCLVIFNIFFIQFSNNKYC